MLFVSNGDSYFNDLLSATTTVFLGPVIKLIKQMVQTIWLRFSVETKVSEQIAIIAI
jgi:hypothetical protein